jgi:hypothetical protein
MAEEKKEPKLWKVTHAFFQVNTFKGGRYLDDTGKILNEYLEYYRDYNVAVNGLHLLHPKTKNLPEEISVDINRIWIACHGEDSIKKINDTSEKIVKAISKYLEISLFTRLGFRAQYFKPFENIKRLTNEVYMKTASSDFQALIKTESAIEIFHNIRYKNPPFSTRLILQNVIANQISEIKTEFSEDGFLIDMDVVEDKESSATTLNFDRVDKFLREATNVLLDKALVIMEYLETINK